MLMRRLVLCIALVCLGYLGLTWWSDLARPDTGFRMAALEVPKRAGQFAETDRADLFVPYIGNPTYSVPADTIDTAIPHDLGRYRWHSYQPETGAGPFPVVLLFHGAGRDGLSMIDMWRDVADRKGVMLIALDGRDQNWPPDRVEPTVLHDIIAQEDVAAHIDPSRVYLFGHSNGAAYVQALINQTEGPWRAAAMHAGFADPASAIIPETPKPIRYYLGSRDHIFQTDAARYVANDLATKGHDVDLHIIPDHTHWFYDAGPAIAADAWTWLESQ